MFKKKTILLLSFLVLLSNNQIFSQEEGTEAKEIIVSAWLRLGPFQHRLPVFHEHQIHPSPVQKLLELLLRRQKSSFLVSIR